jgi:kynurenine formamidase
MSLTAPLTLEMGGRAWRALPVHHDLSIPLYFGSAQPTFFAAAPASETAFTAGSFVGDVREGGSCNCATYTLTPHCNGTHTECVGHITKERISVRDALRSALHLALLVTVTPVPAHRTAESSDPRPQTGDFLITRTALDAAADAFASMAFAALVIRTIPNEKAKRERDYDRMPAPFFTAEAMRWIVERGIEHLVTDLPSVDRANDEGRLTAHRIFWNVRPGATSVDGQSRLSATVTELAYIADEIEDGPYLLNLQIPPFTADAAPSRPILIPIRPL